MSETHFDLVVVGAGIIGLAHAYAAAKRGCSVAVVERSLKASGASIRNFGMIWPIGQPPGPAHEMAIHSRLIWLDLLEAARIPCRRTGSLHLMYREDEVQVAKEFVELAPSNGFDCQWLDASEALERSPAIVAENLSGALWSPTELTVDPRAAMAQLPVFLEECYGVRFYFGTAVHAINLPAVSTGAGTLECDSVIVCGGDDFATLYPGTFATAGITRCKLQMLRTVEQPEFWELGPSLAGGLTLQHYGAFRICGTLPALQQRIAEETPELNHWGIHILVSQTGNHQITLGDSHEYGLAVDIFDKFEIDRLILHHAANFLRLPDWSIAERWHGVYAKHATLPYVSLSPSPNVRIVTSTGGAGMTLSFGLAEQTVREMEL